ncbi:MAG: DEAD/DEAH box helicase [Clostridia bacterium]
MSKSFAAFGFRTEVLQGIEDLYYKEPTSIQTEAIPLIMEGKDVIGQAQTGTGKTAAFVLPILHKLVPGRKDVQALILTPTRELSVQIAAEIEKLGKHLDVNVLSLHGGTDIDKQLSKLKTNVQIVVGTPGRILDHLKRGSLHFGRISTLVLDEADKMLEMGFLDEVAEVLSGTPQQKQVLLFSATMPDAVKKLAGQFMQQPPHIKIEQKQKTVAQIEQLYYVVNQSDKQDALMDLIEMTKPYLAIIFTNTQQRVQHLTGYLKEQGLSAEGLYGDLSQNKREQLMKNFRNIKFQFLVATDIAARGVDVEGVTHVFNYDLPNDTESYIHRVGRTGRAGQTGTAISLVSPRQRSILTRIAKSTNTQIEEKLLTAGRHLDEGRKQRASEREAHFVELRQEKKREAAAQQKQKEAPVLEAIKKNKPVKPGYKKKLAREVQDWQSSYEQKKKREEAKAARKKGPGNRGPASKSAGTKDFASKGSQRPGSASKGFGNKGPAGKGSLSRGKK